MKAYARSFIIASAAIFFLALLHGSPAAAMNDSDLTQTAQMRLASLGYYVGRYDGIMGPVTRTAIAHFQKNNGLPVTGQMTADTYNLLEQKEYMASFAVSHHDSMNAVAWPSDADSALAWDNRWHSVSMQTLSLRYGSLKVVENVSGGLRHYTVMLNDQPVILAQNQPGLLRVSQTFHLNGEDAVMFTAYNGETDCAYRSYLLTIRNDGTHDAPRQVNSCSNAYEAHVTDGFLYISFVNNYMVNGWSTWDIWRYRDGSLMRV